MATHIAATKLVELVEMANKGGKMYACVVDGMLALGADPTNPTVAIDLSVEAVVPYRRDIAPKAIIRASRKSGDYWMEVMGERHEFGSLRDLLGGSLRSIEDLASGSLDKLSRIRPRSKRIVSRDKSALFDAPELVEKYAAPLMDGWWYGINNSADETRTWLERACSCAGLEWGSDFRTNLGK